MTPRKDLLRPDSSVEWKIGKSILFNQGIKVETYLDLDKVKINGSIPASGNIMTIGSDDGKIEFKTPDSLKGTAGAQGATGANGLKGDTGGQGATGANGLKGDTGGQGATGSTGLKGDTGGQGATGATGLKGDNGGISDIEMRDILKEHNSGISDSDIQKFTAGHYYELGEDLSNYIGSPIILNNNRIYTTNTANNKQIIGFLGEISSGGESINYKKLETVGYVIGLGDSFHWKNIKELDSSGNYIDEEVKYINGVKVCNEGGNIEIGDFLTTSSEPEYFMKQSDDIFRNYTAARCMENIEFKESNYKENVYCIMMCG